MRHLILLLLPVLTEAYTTTITLSSDTICDLWSSNEVWAESVYKVQWNGDKLSSTCKLKFYNEDSNRKLCIKANNFNINDCGVWVTYYGGVLGDDIKNSYGCLDSPDEYCSGTFDDVAIKLDATSAGLAPGSFSLKIYSKSNHYPVIIGVSVSLCAIGIIIAIVAIIVCRRRRLATRGALLSSYPPAGATVVTNTSVVNSTGGYNNPNYPSQYAQQPPPYSQTAYPAQNYS